MAQSPDSAINPKLARSRCGASLVREGAKFIKLNWRALKISSLKRTHRCWTEYWNFVLKQLEAACLFTVSFLVCLDIDGPCKIYA